MAFLLLHIRYREFSVLKNTVSDYATGNSVALFNAMGVFAVCTYAVMFIYLLATHYDPTWPIYVLGIGVVGTFALMFFPVDRAGTELTRTGIIHWILAIVNFGALFIFMINVAVPNVATQPTAFVAMDWIIQITFYAFLVTLILPKLRKAVMGLFERLFLVATSLWFIVFSILLL